jgi:hypothetical protein
MRDRDERGVAFPSPLVILSIVAVAMAGLAFIATQESGPADRQAQTVAQPSTSPTPSPRPRPTSAPVKVRKKPAVKRREIFVEVYNNSGVSGLAGTVARRARGAGWNVVGSDNWYGTIPASTVYYPPRLAAAAKALGKDLGIRRQQRAVDPMRFDRLTVILTSDYS